MKIYSHFLYIGTHTHTHTLDYTINKNLNNLFLIYSTVITIWLLFI